MRIGLARRGLVVFIFILAALGGGASYAGESVAAAGKIPAITAPPEAIVKQFSLSPFYKKYIDADGFPIVASEKVSDAAMREAYYIIQQMFWDRDDVRKAMARNKVRLAIMAATEQTTDIPEHSDLTPKDYWDRRARGLGATFERPAVSGAEENLLNLPGDRYAHENILIHEFSHAMHEMGMNTVDPKFNDRLQETFANSMKKGLWKKTYAETNYKEFWAEGVQSYFDANDPNTNASHNGIYNHEKLAEYDPEFFKLIDEAYHHSTWRYVRYDKRQGSGAKPAVPAATPAKPPTTAAAPVTLNDTDTAYTLSNGLESAE